jgi:hypothetical protein
VTEKLLSYWLREIQTAVRIMARDRSCAHAFDLGTTPQGEMQSCIVLVMPKQLADALLEKMVGPIKPKAPLSETSAADAARPQNTKPQ